MLYTVNAQGTITVRSIATYDSPFTSDSTFPGPDAPWPSFNNATLAQQVYEHLRRDILANTYSPDTPLPEEAIAGKLKVSRAPVREALRRLAAEGLVTLIPRQGAVVRSMSPQELLNAYQVREALEVLAIRLATPRLEPEDIETLEQLHRQMARHAAQGNVDAFFAANAAFHALLVDRSGNDKLCEVYEALAGQMRRYYVPSLYLRGGMERSIDEHGEILRAVREREVEEAARLLSEHISVPRRSLESAALVELVPVRVGSRQ